MPTQFSNRKTRAVNTVYIALFMAMITLPLLFVNLKEETISQDENRTLASFPHVYVEDEKVNKDFIRELEAWFNDNVGFRSELVLTNARIQYHVFGQLANNSNTLLGPKGELNYANNAMISDYQHFNRYSTEQLDDITSAYKRINEYLADQGIKYYYVQCWDKHSIYPEQFPTSINQYGSVSKTDDVVDAIEAAGVSVISFKDLLIDYKSEVETYTRYGDPTHWSRRGAYLAYRELMEEINRDSEDSYKILEEAEFDLTLRDMGRTLFGGIHFEQMEEAFGVLNPEAVLTNELISLYSEDQRHRAWKNNSVDNTTRLLILGDSYFNSYLMGMIPESFYETIMIWGDYSENLSDIIEVYHPDIVISENAERVDRTKFVIKAADKLLEMSKHIPSDGVNLLLATNQGTKNFRVSDNGYDSILVEDGKGIKITLLSHDDKGWLVLRYNDGRSKEILEGPEGDVYTISFDVKANIAGTKLSVSHKESNGKENQITFGDAVIGEADNWTHVILTGKLLGTSITSQELYIDLRDNPANTAIWLKNLKMERGSEATEWTAAPEDEVI